MIALPDPRRARASTWRLRCKSSNLLSTFKGPLGSRPNAKDVQLKVQMWRHHSRANVSRVRADRKIQAADMGQVSPFISIPPSRDLLGML